MAGAPKPKAWMFHGAHPLSSRDADHTKVPQPQQQKVKQLLHKRNAARAISGGNAKNGSSGRVNRQSGPL
jgi:hypothetical protein